MRCKEGKVLGWIERRAYLSIKARHNVCNYSTIGNGQASKFTPPSRPVDLLGRTIHCEPLHLGYWRSRRG